MWGHWYSGKRTKSTVLLFLFALSFYNRNSNDNCRSHRPPRLTYAKPCIMHHESKTSAERGLKDTERHDIEHDNLFIGSSSHIQILCNGYPPSLAWACARYTRNNENRKNQNFNSMHFALSEQAFMAIMKIMSSIQVQSTYIYKYEFCGRYLLHGRTDLINFMCCYVSM